MTSLFAAAEGKAAQQEIHRSLPDCPTEDCSDLHPRPDRVRQTALSPSLSASLTPWRPLTTVHDPAKVICHLAISLRLDVDCQSNVVVLRAEPVAVGSLLPVAVTSSCESNALQA